MCIRDRDIEAMKSGTRVNSKDQVNYKACKKDGTPPGSLNKTDDSSSSGSSSSSSGKKQNGQIPGYSACTKRYEGTQVPVSVCCTEVGGKIVKGGSFPVCEK